MKTEYINRIAALRAEMSKRGIDAVIIPQADPHMGEYLAAHWQVRRFFSGFTGSAGDLVITRNDAALWTDSRYFLQAAEQLEGTGIKLMKDGLADTPSIPLWLCDVLPKKSTVGLNGMLFSYEALTTAARIFTEHGILLDTVFDPAESIWTNRPALPAAPIEIHPLQFAGEEARNKIDTILYEASEKGAKAVLLSMLDDIAWTLNIRSSDVRHTPVATAFLFLEKGNCKLFVNQAKLNEATNSYLAEIDVESMPYDDICKFLATVDVPVLIDYNHTAAGISNILGNKAIDGGITSAARLKSVKNNTQIECVRRVMVRDGAALVKAFMEIEQRVADDIPTQETDVAEILVKYRSQGENYRDESFGTIAGYGPHGAIVHYEASAETSSQLRPEGLLLIDSGAQYLDGTTDITRTIALGTPTAREKSDFTLVMKGHIALAKAVFPAGTRGAQLDVLARQFLWQHGMNYLHGTGHGVGFYLSVHEGPHSIRLNNVEAPLLPGSITSNEPGLYIENLHGIRCENLVLCRHRESNAEFGSFLCFETLTLFPFDRSLFDLTLMTDAEIAWVDSYHSMVRERLLPALDTDAERQWLISRTEPLCQNI